MKSILAVLLTHMDSKLVRHTNTMNSDNSYYLQRNHSVQCCRASR